MFIFALLSSLLIVIVIFLDMKSSVGSQFAILSPFFYFSLFWFAAFPLHGYLLDAGWVDTQQATEISREFLIIAILISIISILVVWLGVRSSMKGIIESAYPDKMVSYKITLRMIIVLSALIVGAVLFLKFIMFPEGEWTPFVGNDQNEARFGEGPIFIFSELFIYGLIAVVPLILQGKGSSPLKLILIGLFILGLILAIFMGMALTSRRVIVVVFFAIMLGWLYCRKEKRIILSILLIAATFFATPVLQHVRYLLNPEDLDNLVVNSEELAICTTQNGILSPQKSVKIYSSQNDSKVVSDYNAMVSSWLCVGKSGYIVYSFIQNIASTFGLIDHLANYFQKASISQLITGVDYGKAWLYNAVLGLVPRKIWHDKPLNYGSVGIQKWLYPELYANQQITFTLPPSFIVDSVFGFGLFIGTIILFVYGKFLVWTHIRLLQSKIFHPSEVALALFIMSYLFNVVRSGSGMIQGLIIMLCVLILIYGRGQYAKV